MGVGGARRVGRRVGSWLPVSDTNSNDLPVQWDSIGVGIKENCLERKQTNAKVYIN